MTAQLCQRNPPVRLREGKTTNCRRKRKQVPTLVPTVISWWTLLWREDSVLELAGKETQNNKQTKKGLKREAAWGDKQRWKNPSREESSWFHPWMLHCHVKIQWAASFDQNKRWLPRHYVFPVNITEAKLVKYIRYKQNNNKYELSQLVLVMSF